MTTREEIIAVAKEAGLQTYLTRDCHWTGLGKFYAIAHEAGVASRDAEVARLKTVPMRYRRMAFNAQLQDEVARLEQENDQLRAKINVLREALSSAESALDESRDYPVTYDEVITALITTPEQSLAEYRNKVIEAFVNEFSRHVGGDGEFWLHELQDFAMKEQP